MTETIHASHAYPEAKRAEIRRRANAMGIDETYLSILVEEFYTRIRADARLGPIFEARLGKDWVSHLDRMKAFWASVALNAGSYSGKPVPVHQKLVGIERADFTNWLALFQATLNDTAPSKAAEAYLMERAHRIARSLEIAMFERPADGVPRFG